jgi:hypothetical protein
VPPGAIDEANHGICHRAVREPWTGPRSGFRDVGPVSIKPAGAPPARHPDRGFRAAGVTDRGRPTTEFAARYGAVELPTPDSPPAPNRAFASLWFGDATAPGARTTLGACDKLSRSCQRVVPGGKTRHPHLATLVRAQGLRGRAIRSSRQLCRHRQINGSVALDYFRKRVGLVGPKRDSSGRQDAVRTFLSPASERWKPACGDGCMPEVLWQNKVAFPRCQDILHICRPFNAFVDVRGCPGATFFEMTGLTRRCRYSLARPQEHHTKGKES